MKITRGTCCVSVLENLVASSHTLNKTSQVCLQTPLIVCIIRTCKDNSNLAGTINLNMVLKTTHAHTHQTHTQTYTHSPSSPMRALSSCFLWSVGICQCSSTNRVNRDSRPDVSCCHRDDRKDRRRGRVEG